MMNRTLLNTTLFFAIAFVGSLAMGHEFWIQPEQYIVKDGGLLRVQLMNGERFDGHVVLRDEPQIRRFEFISEGESDVLQGRHEFPVSFVRPSESGVVVYQSNRYQNDLDADRFDAYLREERIEHIINRREEFGESELIGREVYSRCAKSIIQVEGEANSISEIDHVVGLPLEIVVQAVDGGDGVGSTVRALVLYQGEPISGMRVVAAGELSKDELLELWTDESGMIEFNAGHGGAWMLTTLHMVRADQVEAADWESFWASVSFSIDE